MLPAFTVSLPLERSFRPFAELPQQQQTALSGILQAVLFDEELLLALEQVVRAEMRFEAGRLRLGVLEVWMGWAPCDKRSELG